MKKTFQIKEISKTLALNMIQQYHYSNTLPKLNRHFLGFYLDNVLVGVVTLGWGTRPLHTIQKIFPTLTTKDYYEIGRMCMLDEMPRNSESQMISQMVKWLKVNEPSIKILFTWADGVMGKVGYVYQSCSFLYGGYSLTDIYIKDGIKIHPRQTKQFFADSSNDKRITVRPTLKQMQDNNIVHIKGKQFRYIKFLCDKKETKRLLKESLIELNFNYPKEKDLLWKKQIDKKKYVDCEKPYYKSDFNKNITNLNNINSDKQLSLFEI